MQYGPKIATNGLVLAVDASDVNSYSPNVFPNPIDPYAWAVNGGAYQMTLSRDTSTIRQYGSVPLKIVTSGTAAYTATYNASTWNLAPAASGQTWTFSFWTKGSSNYTASAMIFEANSSGAYLTLGQTYYNVTTSWTRVTGSYTFSNASAAYIQFRIDNYNNGVTQWVDSIQIERASTATRFNPNYYGNTIWRDFSGTSNSFTIANAPTYSINSFNFNGSTQFAYNVSAASGFFISSTNNFYADVGYAWTISAWFKFPVSPTTTRNSANNGGNCSYCIVGNGGGIGGAETLALFVSGGDNTTSAGSLAPYLCVVGIRGAKTQLSAGSVNTNTWNNAIVTWNGFAGRGYFNGVDKGALNIGTAGMQVNGYTIGTQVGGNQGAHTFEGDISNVFIYNRALSAAEATQNYNAMKARFGL